MEEVLLGGGANGIAFIDNGARVSVAFEGDVAVYFQGVLTQLDASAGASAESPAHDVLRMYTSGQLAPGVSSNSSSNNNNAAGGHLAAGAQGLTHVAFFSILTLSPFVAVSCRLSPVFAEPTEGIPFITQRWFPS